VITILVQELSLAGLFNVLSTKPVLNKVSILGVLVPVTVIVLAYYLHCTDAGG